MENIFPGSQQETLISTLGITITEATKDRVCATMPVGPRSSPVMAGGVM